MRSTARQTRENRTITVDFHNEATYLQLLGDGKAFVELVIAFLFALGFQLTHKATCHGGGCLTRHSHYVRVRLGGLTIWRIQCTRCKAVFTILPHFALRYRSRLLLDSRVVDVPMESNPTFVILTSWKPLFINSLKNELCFSDNAGV